MRVLNSFMTILVLGFFGSAIAQERTDNVGQPTRSTVLGFTPEEIEGFEKEDCEQNGGPEAYKSLTEGWQNFLNCTGPLLNMTELEADRTVVFSEGKWDKFTKKYCLRLPSFVQCVGRMVESTKPCLDAEDKEIFGSYHNISSLFMEFMCQNDGRHLASFLNDGGMQCLVSKAETIQEDCDLESSSNKTNNESIDRTIPWIELVRKDCTVMENFRNCTVRVLRTCESSTPANIFESVFNFFKNRNSCSSTSQTQTSPAT